MGPVINETNVWCKIGQNGIFKLSLNRNKKGETGGAAHVVVAPPDGAHIGVGGAKNCGA